jgi:ElaA protein
LTFEIIHFADLNTEQLYAILRLRQEVFIIEQQCNYLDCDNRDQDSYHLLGKEDGRVLAYCRLLPKGVAYPEYASIGRVLTHADVRRGGHGRPMMRSAVQYCQQLWPGDPIKIGAQSYLHDFYSGLGFVSTGEHYLEDDIPHQKMDYKGMSE